MCVRGGGGGAINSTHTSEDNLLTNYQNGTLINLCTFILMSGQP